MRAFSDEEKLQIQQDLIRSYETCLNKVGLQKTSIDEIVRMAGISKGSFYLFYESKDALFLDVLDSIQQRVVSTAYEVKPSPSPRQTMVEILNCVYQEIKKTPWLLNLDGLEYERMLRRLPPDLLERHMSQDSLDITKIADKFGIKLRVSLETATAMIRILLYPILLGDKIGPQADEAVRLLIRGAAEQAVAE